MDGCHDHGVDATVSEENFAARLSNHDGRDLHGRGRAYVLKISRAVVVNELIKSLDRELLSTNCVCTPNGYSASIRAKVPESKQNAEIVEFIGYSCASHDTELEAIEKAAEDLIISLQTKFTFGINDINWEISKRLEASVDNLEKKVASLKNLVDSLVDGWAYSLEFANILCSMSAAIYSSAHSELSAGGFAGTEIVISNTLRLKNLAKLAWIKGTNAMRRVLRSTTI